MSGRYIRVPTSHQDHRFARKHICVRPPIRDKVWLDNEDTWIAIAPPENTIWECECGKQYKTVICYDVFGQPFGKWVKVYFKRKKKKFVR